MIIVAEFHSWPYKIWIKKQKQDMFKNLLMVKLQHFLSYPHEPWWKISSHDVIIFSKLYENKKSIVDFLLLANLWIRLVFLFSNYIDLIFSKHFSDLSIKVGEQLLLETFLVFKYKGGFILNFLWIKLSYKMPKCPPISKSLLNFAWNTMNFHNWLHATRYYGVICCRVSEPTIILTLMQTGEI